MCKKSLVILLILAVMVISSGCWITIEPDKTATETETKEETIDTTKTPTEAESTQETVPSKFEEQVLTAGAVYEAVKGVWSDVVVTDLYDKEVGARSARIEIYTSEATPLENARKYFDIMLQIKDTCTQVFTDADYIRVSLNFLVRDFDGSLYFYTMLKPDDGSYVIEEFMPSDMIKLSDKAYVDAIEIALDEIE